MNTPASKHRTVTSCAVGTRSLSSRSRPSSPRSISASLLRSDLPAEVAQRREGVDPSRFHDLRDRHAFVGAVRHQERAWAEGGDAGAPGDRKSTRLNSSHMSISYAVFCLKK